MRTVLPEPGYSREVAVSATDRGAIAVHVAWREDGERAVLQELREGQWRDPVVLAGPRRAVRRPSVLDDGLAAWAEKRRGPMRVVVRTPGGRICRFPAGTTAPFLARDGAGAAAVAIERFRGRRRWIEVRSVPKGTIVVRTPRELHASDPALAFAADGPVLAFEAEGGVFVQRSRGRPMRLSDPRSLAAAPAVARLADGRVAVAWHECTLVDGRPELPRWFTVRVLERDGARALPDPPGKDVDASGEDQGMEFPVLVPARDGGFVVLARASHCFYRQDLGPEGWTGRTPISDVVWGCRGRRAAGCVLPDGRVLVVRREREGLVAEELDPPRGDGRSELRSPIPVAPARRTRVRSAARRVVRSRSVSLGGLRAFFGDIHQHSAHSDATGTAEERFLASRDVYGDDFAALSDHESFLGKRTGPGEWTHLEEVTERFHEPGRFVTLFAYEWTAAMHPGPGHKVVYWPRPGLGVLSRDDPRTRDGQGLVAAVRRRGGLAFPHHVGWTGADVASHDPRVQTCWEICSCHGCYETHGHPLGHRGTLPGQFVQENLDAGLRFGFVGGSDGHGLVWHHGACRKRDSFRTGLTGFLAPRITRAALWDALRRRRCYATSGAKIALSVLADGRPMGSELRTAGPVEMDVRFAGTARVELLEAVTTFGRALDFEPRARRGRIRFDVVLEPSAAWAYFYVRLVQEDGEMAWSSPVWLDRP